MTEDFVSDIEALFECKKRLLVAAVGDAYHQRVENARRAPNEVFVTARQRVERARVHGDYHETSPLFRQKGTSARPCDTFGICRVTINRPAPFWNAHYSLFSRCSK